MVNGFVCLLCNPFNVAATNVSFIGDAFFPLQNESLNALSKAALELATSLSYIVEINYQVNCSHWEYWQLLV